MSAGFIAASFSHVTPCGSFARGPAWTALPRVIFASAAGPSARSDRAANSAAWRFWMSGFSAFIFSITDWKEGAAAGPLAAPDAGRAGAGRFWAEAGPTSAAEPTSVTRYSPKRELRDMLLLLKGSRNRRWAVTQSGLHRFTPFRAFGEK